jgi:hypothetical protein
MSIETSRPQAAEPSHKPEQPSAASVSARRYALLRMPVIVAVFVVAGIFWGWCDAAARTDPATGRLVRQDDWQVYRAAGVALREGTPLYAVRNDRGWPYLYPPLVAVLAIPFTFVPERAEMFAWFLANLTLATACFALMHSIAMSIQPAHRRVPVVWAHVVALIPLIETLHRGQANVVMLFFLAAGLWLLRRGRPALGGLVLAGASAIKVTPLLLGIWMVWKLLRALWTDRASAARPVAALAGFVAGILLWWWAVPAMFLGPARAAGLLAEYHSAVTGQYLTIGEPPTCVRTLSPELVFARGNQSWYRLFGVLSGADGRPLIGPSKIAFYGWMLLLLAGFLWLCRAVWEARASDALMCEAAVAVLLGVTAGMVAWSHTYLIAWPLLVFAERTVQPDITWRSRTLRSLWIAFLWAFTILWLALAVDKGAFGPYFSLLLSSVLVATVTLWRLERCQSDRLTAAPETN